MRSMREWFEHTMLPAVVLVLIIAGISLGLAAAATSAGHAVGPWFVVGVALALSGMAMAVMPVDSGGKHRR